MDFQMTMLDGTLVASRDRTHFMDILRGLLASWVVLHHVVLTAGVDANLYPWRLLAHHGQEAVLVFFILSGFAIARSLQTQPQRWSSFLIARFWRIYPVYLIALGTGAAVYMLVHAGGDGSLAGLRRLGIEVWDAGEGSPLWLHLFLHLSQWHGLIPAAWLPHADTSLVAPAWSLSTEFQFYVIAPALCFLLLHPAALANLRVVTLLGIAFLTTELALNPAIAPASVLRYLDLFALGIAGARLHQSDLLGKLIYCLVAVVIALLDWHADRIIGTNAIAVWLLFWLASIAVPSRLLHGRLGSIGLFVGAISYPLYLIHYPLLRLTLFAANQAFPNSRGGLLALWIPAAILLSYAGSILLHRYVEVHGTRYGKRMAARHELRQSCRQMLPQSGAL